MKIKKANYNEDIALVLSLIVLATANYVNCFTLGILVITMFDLRSSYIPELYLHYRYFALFLALIIFFLPNYLLLIFNRKHEKLMRLYSNDNNVSWGFNYFVISAIIAFTLILSTILFPAFFGLKSAA
ncbi:hypothetical protein [Flavobacterium sp.]|uniref:hypothetical protein n=1 Tax=Flavobacterium sp. TaxID=239 RepID=UPI002621F38F|nr:hypothetical protein [Flavobacterium sp.]